MSIDENERLNREKESLLESLQNVEREVNALTDSLEALKIASACDYDSPTLSAAIKDITKRIDDLKWRIKLHKQEINNIDIERYGCKEP